MIISIYKDIKSRFNKDKDVMKFDVEVETDEISDGVFNVVVTKSPTELNEKQILDLKAKLSEKLRADGEFVSSMSIEVLKSTKSKRTRTITQNVKDRVWNRDGGKCVQCDSNENLEFDHIIPFSKGGANTYRNIQLLCEQCNRQKSNKIG
jgi:CRISPR/Cas system Type II protein with McrA/HNH and RuvC-like nuclease domain